MNSKNTKAQKKQKESSKIGMLITEESVAGLTLYPWTLATLIQISPILLRISTVITKSKLKIDLSTVDKSLPFLITAVLPELPEIFAVTLRKDVNEMKELSADVAIVLALRIVQQNLGYLKNSLGPAIKILQATTKQMIG